MLLFTENHEWVSISNDVATIGITEFAQEQLGDIIYIQVPDIGQVILQGSEVVVIESVKAAGEIKSPVSGTVIDTNPILEVSPEVANNDAMEEGWFFKLRVDSNISLESEISHLLDQSSYELLTRA